MEVLSELMYSNDTRAPLRLYIYNQHGYHSGGQWFRRKPIYPMEEIPFLDARQDAEDAISLGLEVRICNGADLLVFHSKDGRVLYPANPLEFWEKACK